MASAMKETEADDQHRQPDLASSSADAGGMQVGIGQFGAWMLGVGAIIGSMAWLIHGPMLAKAGPLASLTAWLIACFMTLPLALILAELSSMFPTAGGPYVYKYYAFKRLIPGAGEMIGFLTGWLFFVAILTGLSCMSNGLAALLASAIWGDPAASPLWFGAAVIVGLFASTTCLNLLRVAKATTLNNVITLIKLFAAVAFAALVCASPTTSLSYLFQIQSPSGGDFLSNVTSVLMLAVAGYAGVEVVGCTAAETVNARKTVPRAILSTLIAVAVIYMAMCAAVSVAAPYSLSGDGTTMVITSHRSVQANCPAVAAFVGGQWAGSLMFAAVVISIIGCSFTCLLTCARVGYSMAKTGFFPAQFAHLDRKTKVPTYTLWFQFVCLCVIGVGANLLARTGCCPDAYSFLGEVFGFMYSFAALLYGFCLLSLRYTDPDMPRPFRLGRQGNLVAWLMTIATTLVYGYAAFACAGRSQQLTGAVLLISGVPVYLFYRMRRAKAAALLMPDAPNS